METTLQKTPPNIIFTKNEFLGRNTAVASLPSLSWLNSQTYSLIYEKEKYCSWIPNLDTNLTDLPPTLNVITEQLTPIFEQFNIRLNKGQQTPDNFKKSELVIVAAHGGVFPEENYFHVIADDNNLCLHYDEFVEALSNTGLVILFVCSGERVDTHPHAKMTKGLTKRLFVHGCSSIIASP